MLVDVHENTVGMIVDSVTEVMRLPKDKLSPPPKGLATKIHQDFMEGVGKLDKRLILLLNLEVVILRDDVEQIAQKGA